MVLVENFSDKCRDNRIVFSAEVFDWVGYICACYSWHDSKLCHEFPYPMIRIFIAYSSKDLVFKEEIRKRLRPLQRAGKVDVWDNYNIEAGKDWDAEVREKLANADLVLLLLSPDALDSEYFYKVEAPIALARHQAGEAIAVGVLLRPCSFRYTPFEFGKYELLPKKGYPITDSRWHNSDEAYLSVFEAVDDLVVKMKEFRDKEKAERKRLEKDRLDEMVENEKAVHYDSSDLFAGFPVGNIFFRLFPRPQHFNTPFVIDVSTGTFDLVRDPETLEWAFSMIDLFRDACELRGVNRPSPNNYIVKAKGEVVREGEFWRISKKLALDWNW